MLIAGYLTDWEAVVISTGEIEASFRLAKSFIAIHLLEKKLSTFSSLKTLLILKMAFVM